MSYKYAALIIGACWAVSFGLVGASMARAETQQRYPNGHCYGYAVPSLDCVSPDWTGVVQRWSSMHVPADRRGSDVQCYSAVSGRPYVQRIGAFGPYWTAFAHGHDVAVAAYDRVHHDFVNMTHRSVICASWAD
jgi:hypothetical protein